jgi:hypothetical protein
LRGLMLSYIPYAYWGSDSKSYFSFAYELLSRGQITLDTKRRYIYPIWMLFVAVLPGSPLRWTAWLQHLLGLATLFPLAYTVRKVFAWWRWLIVPVTLFFAGLPVILWYEHELIGECLFVDMVVWACAGWAAWVAAPNLKRSQELWWWFFVPFALMMLTKPSGRFYLPGLILGFIIVRGWRVLNWRHGGAFMVVLLLTLGMGREAQSSWLLYSTAFPLTRLDTPLHADYKNEIRDMVEESRANLDTYYDEDRSGFLRRPKDAIGRPLWIALAADPGKRTRIYKELALEGIKHRPDLLLYISIQRTLASANSSDFKQQRFAGDTYAERFAHLYREIVAEKPDYLRFLFGMSKSAPLPNYQTVTQWISPAPDGRAAAVLQNYVTWFSDTVNFIDTPAADDRAEGKITAFRPSLLGWLLGSGAMLSLVISRYRKSLGVWTLAAGGYLLGTFLLGVPSPRYFSPAWPVMVLLLALPAEWIVLFIQRTLLNPRRKDQIGQAL